MAELFFDRIFGNLYFRKLYHFLVGMVLVFALILLEKNWFILLAAVYFVAFFFIGKRISFAILGVLLVYLLTGSKNLTLYTTVIWLVGDGMASLVGGAFGERKLPLNKQKTILGSVSFFLSSWIAILALFMLTIEGPRGQLFFLSTTSCLVACLVESLPVSFIRDRKPDDNLIVLLLTSLTMWSFSMLSGLESLLG